MSGDAVDYDCSWTVDLYQFTGTDFLRTGENWTEWTKV